ncbi:hypothetical protein ACFROC_19395 [Nocardia tengchongensis]|uniref:hypothetical protein n=1 Tax=Nocardia tengchongensis TaxID=2055889 RepID=UPI00369878A2
MRKIALTAIRALAARAAATPAVRKTLAKARKLSSPVECVVRNGFTTDQQLRHVELILIGDVLADAGFDADFIHHYSGEAGKRVKRAWVAAHDCVPQRVWTRHRTSGRPIKVYAYPADEHGLHAISTGLGGYARTADRFAAA